MDIEKELIEENKYIKCQLRYGVDFNILKHVLNDPSPKFNGDGDYIYEIPAMYIKAGSPFTSSISEAAYLFIIGE